MLTKEFIEEMKQALLAQKQKLQNDLVGLNPKQNLGDDLDSNAQEVGDNEVAADVIARINNDLQKIDKALAKIENNSYGMDDNGKEISQGRLRAMPWADTAI